MYVLNRKNESSLVASKVASKKKRQLAGEARNDRAQVALLKRTVLGWPSPNSVVGEGGGESRAVVRKIKLVSKSRSQNRSRILHAAERVAR